MNWGVGQGNMLALGRDMPTLHHCLEFMNGLSRIEWFIVTWVVGILDITGNNIDSRSLMYLIGIVWVIDLFGLFNFSILFRPCRLHRRGLDRFPSAKIDDDADENDQGDQSNSTHHNTGNGA